MEVLFTVKLVLISLFPTKCTEYIFCWTILWQMRPVGRFSSGNSSKVGCNVIVNVMFITVVVCGK